MVRMVVKMRAELRPDGDGGFDELVAQDVASVHAEMMSDKTLWIGVEGADGERWTMWISAHKGKLVVTAHKDA